MRFGDADIKRILLEGNYLTGADTVVGERYAAAHHVSFLSALFAEEILSKEIAGQAIAESFGVAYVNLDTLPPAADLAPEITLALAKKFRLTVLDRDSTTLTVATDDPGNSWTLSALRDLFPKLTVRITFALPEDIDRAFNRGEPGLETRFSEIIRARGRVAPEIVEQIVEDAVLLKASDIHCEPQEEEVIVRFRVDGVLHEAGRIPIEYYENIINRLKVQAKLRIDEHFSAQDGAIRFVSDRYPEPLDLRISIVPTIAGEKVAIRILSSYVDELSLANIGLPDALQEQIMRSAGKPFGMILVTGPTGSGKTTTLYSLIRTINTQSINITTIEDPVEYKIPGINQIQANAQSNLSFAQGLRAIARQDPNVILVGEIRDLETADIAVNAALTGHLMLSTFHANNAATAIPRFIDMGVEPFLVGSTIELVISQRLVRTICNACKVSYVLDAAGRSALNPAAARFFPDAETTLYRGKGCSACSHTGYKGRIGVYEYYATSPELQDLIGKQPSTKDVTTLIRSQGYLSMFEAGLEKVKTGVTTIEELTRVVNPESVV